MSDAEAFSMPSLLSDECVLWLPEILVRLPQVYAVCRPLSQNGVQVLSALSRIKYPSPFQAVLGVMYALPHQQEQECAHPE